jgi:hypothetical protein
VEERRDVCEHLAGRSLLDQDSTSDLATGMVPYAPFFLFSSSLVSFPFSPASLSLVSISEIIIIIIIIFFFSYLSLVSFLFLSRSVNGMHQMLDAVERYSDRHYRESIKIALSPLIPR